MAAEVFDLDMIMSLTSIYLDEASCLSSTCSNMRCVLHFQRHLVASEAKTEAQCTLCCMEFTCIVKTHDHAPFGWIIYHGTSTSDDVPPLKYAYNSATRVIACSKCFDTHGPIQNPLELCSDVNDDFQCFQDDVDFTYIREIH